MIDNGLHLRIIENKDWATILFVLSFAIIAITKSVFKNRFVDFTNLMYSDKYSNVYRDSSSVKRGFIISLFVVQIVSLAFFFQLLLPFFGYALKTDWILYIQIITILTFFILAKFLIEKIIAIAFDIEEFVEQFGLQKLIFRTYIGLFVLPINVVLFYNDNISRNFLILLAFVLLGLTILSYLVSIKIYHKIIFSKLFYFILYLCALEIAPYYFMYYWFTKSIA